MAKSGAVWGIDIGQCALKALRCGLHDDPTRLLAEGFDFIEYPKILTQPEANPEELVRDALEQFLSRNRIVGDRVAISVSGQSGLARFIKLPPVESKKIPDIVKYEAKQQIPFALEDVVWDYQQMAGGSVEEGFALETEVGLFAMKRDQVYRALKPLTDAGIGVDFVQLTPLTIYNFVVFDLMRDLPPPEEFDPDNPPPSTVVISLGTDSTDLVVTNGYRVWQRNVPIGGNHFTKALTKELRLTFAKAEHTKRNATKAENPKAVFQAMRPIFSDLVTEIERSIGFFTSLDRNARIEGVVALGNALKLPGLHRYLSDNLKQDVQTVKAFHALEGDAVITSPQFQENMMSFGVCYGLCLQGLGRAKISTNLLPQEIVTQRLIREKKPWAVAGVTALLVGCAMNFVSHVSAWHSANILRDDFQTAIRQAEGVKRISNDLISGNKNAVSEFERIDAIGNNLLSNVEGRLLWLELLKAIDVALPKDDPQKKPEKIGQRRELHIQSLECQKFEDLATWYQGIEKRYQENYRAIFGRNPGEAQPQPGAPAGTPASAPAADSAGTDGSDTGSTAPTGPGWVIELRGYHYHNDDTSEQGPTFLRNTLLRNLHENSVKLPDGEKGELVDVRIQDLGIGYPVMVSDNPIDKQPQFLPDPSAAPVTAVAPGDARTLPVGLAQNEQKGGGDVPPQPAGQNVQRFDFVVQFCWIETPRGKRQQIAKERAETARAAAEVAAKTSDPSRATAPNPAGGA